ncbi:DUF4397 domain-containing protein [Pseudoflavitalea sp. G-6-1-2]|uniref:DUF4397 domain-containing protein n=1 Tax=Pseudoflavitalea sp. G-6-1-2 TaxID=2728841 RepID=UPI00146AAED0|nr:DUF4397 domain-containing protein [Pseudoflavitalea sp. G-6-1-2]NML23790.1 DUF4397 domain-containing protein [Pseudoflavitalea sp. G-6-1-2]
MKKVIYSSLALLAGVLMVASCKKNEIKYGDFDLVGANQALFKVNFLSQYKTNPSVVFSIDGKRVNNPITARTPFPGGGLNTGGGSTANYMVFNSGTYNFSVIIPSKLTNEDSLVLYKTSISLEGGKYQTLHITDTAITNGQDNTFSTMVTDDLNRPDTSTVRYRFVNLMPNSPALNLYYDSTLVAENVAYKETKIFTKPASLVAAKAGWWVRATGVTTGAALVTYTTEAGVISSQANQRVFTLFTSGYLGLASPDTRRPYLSFVFNL